MQNEITLPELMPPGDAPAYVTVRRKPFNITKSAKIVAAVLVLCATLCLLFVLNAVFPRNSDTSDGGYLPPPTSGSVEDELSENPSDAGSLPVLLPVGEESETISESDDVSAETEETKKEPQSGSESESPSIPDGAIPIKDIYTSGERAKVVNYSSHSFNVEFLEVMSSAVIAPKGNEPVVLVISPHTSECYLPSGLSYYDPDEHAIHSSDPNLNMIAVGKSFCASLEEAGVKTVHITTFCDADGSNKAYIKARIEIANALAKYPGIKYVVELDRASDMDPDGNLVRSCVILGSKSYAPVKLTVSGGGSLGYSRICQNLSFALKLNEYISEQRGDLTRPVQICDAVYTDGSTPRTLKIEIGSCTSTLDEATASASLVGELFALLLNS